MSATSLIAPPAHVPLPSGAPFITRVRSVLRNPMALFGEPHFHARIISTRTGKRRFGVVMVPELAQKVLQTPDIFGQSDLMLRLLKPALGEGLLTVDGDVWRHQRKAASPAFRARALAGLIPTFQAAGARAADRLAAEAGNVLDVAPHTTQATFEVISQTLLYDETDTSYSEHGFPEDISVFIQTIGRLSAKEVFPLLTAPFPRRFFVKNHAEGQRAIARLKAFSEKIVEKRRLADQSEATDLMGLLIDAEDPETGAKLSPRELVDNALTFVGAGHETTAVALAWILYILAHDRTWQEKIADEVASVFGDAPITADKIYELQLTEKVVKEALRLFPPVPVIPRLIKQEVSIEGMSFAPGDHLSVGIYPMHRHRDLWSDPDSFDPERFTDAAERERHRFQYLPFGGGPRVCIGQRFATLEAVTILGELMRKIRVAVPDGTAAPEPYLTVTMRPMDGMPLLISRA